jgi:hypothetical protein
MVDGQRARPAAMFFQHTSIVTFHHVSLIVAPDNKNNKGGTAETFLFDVKSTHVVENRPCSLTKLIHSTHSTTLEIFLGDSFALTLAIDLVSSWHVNRGKAAIAPWKCSSRSSSMQPELGLVWHPPQVGLASCHK